MTKSKTNENHRSPRKSKHLEKDILRRFYRVLKIFKDREDPKMNIFLPNFHECDAKNSEINIPRLHCLMMIERNLFLGKYTNHPWKFIRDVNSVFEYKKSKHSKRTKIHNRVLEYQDIFFSQMDVLMEEMGYCCGHWYTQKSRKIDCGAAKNCFVLDNSFYYRYEEYTFCQKCFSNVDKSFIELNETKVEKSSFVEFFYIPSKNEAFVRCKSCSRKFHEICVLFNRFFGQQFICRKCRNIEIKPNHLRASNLPPTECDVFINNFLKKYDVNDNDTLTIRLLSDMEKKLNVKETFLGYRSGPRSYAYRNCTLFTFCDTGNESDICFFSVMFQLYGNDCPEPNRNIGYISYIDSINLIPSKNRTLIYRLILLGLFEYLKTKGFDRIILWSCPSDQDHDYIFYMKPAKMIMPTKKRLIDWYNKLFSLGIELNVINSYTEVMDYVKEKQWKGINDIPYLSGDLWVVRMEEAIEDTEKEKNKLIKEIYALHKRMEGLIKKGSQRKVCDAQNRFNAKLQQLSDFDCHEEVWKLMEYQIKAFSKEYFILNLSVNRNEVEKLPPQIDYEWINNRHMFVDYFWEQMLESSDERKAQYTTLVMMHRIFLERKICIECRTILCEGISRELLCKQCHEQKYNSEEVPPELKCDEVLEVSSESDEEIFSTSSLDLALFEDHDDSAIDLSLNSESTDKPESSTINTAKRTLNITQNSNNKEPKKNKMTKSCKKISAVKQNAIKFENREHLNHLLDVIEIDLTREPECNQDENENKVDRKFTKSLTAIQKQDEFWKNCGIISSSNVLHSTQNNTKKTC
ncbi:CLUMA_CG007996, isoform A [Clunio marinus]|uniref:histone acetyltransferase n=1 Tax=Clunio marinus TaxID=568069 RepID=A0A1J1I415_9DIPT|nr:CLUMA_CG007996, isoform A [Clunio marinus]